MAPYYPLVLTVHSWLRVAVVLLCLVVAVRSASAALASRPYGLGDRRLTLWLTIALDLQLVIGLLLHLALSPTTRLAFQDFGAAMKDDERRKWAVEHPTMMLAAIALWHAARIIGKRSLVDSARHRWHAIAASIALLLLYVGSSWPWSAISRPFLRFGG
jgi:hypothetical protein